MKHRHLIALLQEGYTTIQVVFNDDVRGRSKPYTYKAPLYALHGAQTQGEGK